MSQLDFFLFVCMCMDVKFRTKYVCMSADVASVCVCVWCVCVRAHVGVCNCVICWQSSIWALTPPHPPQLFGAGEHPEEHGLLEKPLSITPTAPPVIPSCRHTHTHTYAHKHTLVPITC